MFALIPDIIFCGSVYVRYACSHRFIKFIFITSIEQITTKLINLFQVVQFFVFCFVFYKRYTSQPKINRLVHH